MMPQAVVMNGSPWPTYIALDEGAPSITFLGSLA